MKRPAMVYVLLLLALAAVAGSSLVIGTTGASFSLTWRQLLLPRLLMGMVAGASLATAGAMFQALFRNPLASPYTLGVSSGASLGAALATVLFVGGIWHGVPVLNLFAFLGALACMSIVYGIAHLRAGASISTLLLAGVTIGFICAAGIVFLLFWAQQHDMTLIVRWMMGSLEIVGFVPLYDTVVLAALAGAGAIWLHRDLDLLMMGETFAASRGVNVRRVRTGVYFAGSLLTAAVVARCGPIGFVGLMMPHIMRRWVGPLHRRLIPAAALAGAVFLPLCDLVARNLLWWLRGESRAIPVGALTALIGGSFFLYLLIARSQRPERNHETLHQS